MRVPPPVRFGAIDQARQSLIRRQANQTIEQCQIDVLTFSRDIPVVQRGKDRDRRIQSRRQISNGIPTFCGPPPGSSSRSPVMLISPLSPWKTKS